MQRGKGGAWSPLISFYYIFIDDARSKFVLGALLNRAFLAKMPSVLQCDAPNCGQI